MDSENKSSKNYMRKNLISDTLKIYFTSQKHLTYKRAKKAGEHEKFISHLGEI